ncbi:MAG TPA: hypothetical protein VFW23_09105 [Tepidisphaeraceae bacterium]|nr:hypothetical protein [Tepidisphaeraceae bacterium]
MPRTSDYNAAAIGTMILLLPLVGCTSLTDVSNDSRYQFGFRPGQVYRLNSAAELLQFGKNDSDWVLHAPGAESTTAGVVVRGTLPAGSRLRIDRLVHETIAAPVQGESHVLVYATLLDPPWVGRQIEIGWSMCHTVFFQAPDGWPTVAGRPDSAYLAIEDETRKR